MDYDFAPAGGMASADLESKLAVVQAGFVTLFNKAFESTPSFYTEIAMTAPSSGEGNLYRWLGQLPNMREWVGERVIQNVQKYKYTIENRLFESTLSVKRTAIEDDSYGVYKPLVEENGRAAKRHPEELVFELLNLPDTDERAKCFDGLPFFAANHPAKDKRGLDIESSNVTDGEGTPWFLFDCSRSVKPLIFQQRTPYEFTAIADPKNTRVFMQDEYLFGTRARVNAGFGFWQLAHKSRQPLTVDTFAVAWEAMRARRGDRGSALGIVPTHLVVPVSLEKTALEVMASHVIKELAGGPVVVPNIWAGKVKVIASDHLE